MLERVGLDLEDIKAVGVSHLHVDHSGGLKHFAGRVPVHLQQREWHHGLSGDAHPEDHAMIRGDYDDRRIDWLRVLP